MMKDVFIGVDIGGTRTKYGLVNMAGEVMHSLVLPTEKSDAALFLSQVSNAIGVCRTVAAKNGCTAGGIGIGVPGFTTAEGVVVTTYGFLSFMENYPLQHTIEAANTISCAIDNDARVVCFGEAVFGKGKGYKRVLALTLGTGVGFGFVVDGRFTDVLPLSHMGGNLTITGEGGVCYCGKKGCLEALVSSTGIINAAKEEGLLEIISAEDVFSHAQNGNAGAERVMEKLTGYLHTAIYNYSNLFAPDIIVLGGGIAKGLGPYLDKIKGQTYMGPYPGYDFALALSDLRESAGILGAAALVHARKTSTINSL